jgi:hypothetical protein
MIQVQQETNIEILKEYAECLERSYADLFKKYNSLRNHIEASKQDWLNGALRDQLTRLQKKFFGGGREGLTQGPRRVGHKDQQLKLHGERYQNESKTEASKKASDLPPEPKVVYHQSSKEDLEMEKVSRGIKSDKAEWDQLTGVYQDSVEITIVERVYQKIIHKQAKYKLRGARDEIGKEVIVTAPGPVKVKPGCQYSIDFALSVVCDKYEYHIPLERQRRKMESAGLSMEPKTLYNLCKNVAEHCEGRVVDSIKKDMFGDFCALHLDESPWKILGTKQSGYMWAASNRIGSYYQFEPSRSGNIAEEILENFEGSILVDGFPGYNRFKKRGKIRVGHCWAHARREFYELEASYPEQVGEIVPMIDELFAIEGKARSFDELRVLRKTESLALTNCIYKWLFATRSKFIPSQGIVKAIDYSLKFWPELTMFLKDLSLPLSNNDAERALRHVVLGRKNFAGSRSIDGADIAATLYTVIESSKKVGLEPKDYLKYVITEHWHKREPKSPTQISTERFGKNQRVIFPPKMDWVI